MPTVIFATMLITFVGISVLVTHINRKLQKAPAEQDIVGFEAI